MGPALHPLGGLGRCRCGVVAHRDINMSTWQLHHRIWPSLQWAIPRPTGAKLLNPTSFPQTC